MKTILLIFMSSVLLVAQTTTKQAAKRPVRPDTASATEIPAGATQVEPFIYRYTDAQGKTWMYRKSPFGVMKWEEKDTPQPLVQNADPIVVTDLGDSVRFARKSPFGDQVWTSKKSELSAEEKSILERDQQIQRADPGKQPSGKSTANRKPVEKP